MLSYPGSNPLAMWTQNWTKSRDMRLWRIELLRVKLNPALVEKDGWS